MMAIVMIMGLAVVMWHCLITISDFGWKSWWNNRFFRWFGLEGVGWGALDLIQISILI